MSKATTNTLILMSMAHEALLIAQEIHKINSIYIVDADSLLENYIYTYPATGRESKNYDIMIIQCKEWKNIIGGTYKWSAFKAIHIAITIITDLLTVVKSKQKVPKFIKILNLLNTAFRLIDDNNVDEFTELHEGATDLEKLYDIIGFVYEPLSSNNSQ